MVSSVLSADLTTVYQHLTAFAGLESFWTSFDTVFGTEYNLAVAQSFRAQWQSGDFSWFPQIEVVSSDVLGSANGAYAISTNKIYLSDQFVSTTSRQSLEAVILEEFGHFVDAQVNAVDSAGDEGAIFAALVAGESLNVGTLQALRAEDDHAIINLNGQAIQVEQSVPNAEPFLGTLYTQGRFLYDSSGQKIILRGVNLPLLDDWDFPQSNKLAELEKTGANAVRIEWYKNYGNASRPSYSVQDLDNFLEQCKTKKIIPILGLWDATCYSDPNILNTQLMSWWTSAPVVNVLKKHQQHLIINLANELGFYHWAGNPTTALNTFKAAYKTAITSMRQQGFHAPIMIDAPDGGASLDALTAIGQELINYDPDHNLLLSAHAYWAGYDGMPYINTAVQANLPITFGEVANKQDEEINGVTQYGYYDLDGSNTNHPPLNNFTYQALLQTLKTNDIGWLSWSWWKDNLSVREMTSTGNFANLTTYGNDLVNNTNYGLKGTAQRSTIFVDTFTGTSGNESITATTGDDVIYPLRGVDIVDGGAATDLLVVDYSSNTYGGISYALSSNGSGGFNGYFSAYYNSNSYDRVNFTNIERFQITGTEVADNIATGDGNDSITGGAGDDILNGSSGNDKLYGGNGNDILQGTNGGAGQQDYLNGGLGSDRFILGSSTWIGYDDGLTTNAGTNDYAEIADFNTTEGDIIQLKGGVNYLLNVVGTDTQLFIDKPNTEPDELIAIIKNRTGLSLTGSYFVYNPSITLVVAPASVTEDGTANLVYTFTRTGDTTNALTVNYGITGTADATDYTGETPGTGKTIPFAAGSATAILTIDPTADTTIEANETVVLTLATGTGYTIGTTTAVTGTITNDDGATITLGLNYSGISEDSPSNFVYTFTRTGATTNALTVNYNIAGTAVVTDYTGATPGTGKTITFAAGSNTATLTIDPTADTIVEPNETISLQLATGPGYSIGTTTAQIATIINDDGTRRHVGTSGNDVLLGTTANDYLIGGAGDDNLTGGAGGDIFSFANPNLGNDSITDFTPGQDTILVSAQGFGGSLVAGDTITSEQFVLGSSATTTSQRFIYNSTNGAFLFDVDGSGTQAAKQIATLNTGLALTFEDILVS